MRLFLILLLLALVMLGFASTTCAQVNVSPTIVTIKHYDNEPVKIVSVKYDGKEFAENEPFDAPANWLGSVSVRVKNASARTVTFVYLSIEIPRDKGMHRLIGVSLFRGIFLIHGKTRDTEPLSLEPAKKSSYLFLARPMMILNFLSYLRRCQKMFFTK